MRPPACIRVLAGTNGSGKSSIGGATLRQAGTEYFNPDEVTTQFRSLDPELTADEANSKAWRLGKSLLEAAISRQMDFNFETTLGGKTITALLELALQKGLEVRIWYVGLESPELNLQRVRSRVRKGGHDIPEHKIRERYVSSVGNLARLLPKATEVRVFDNSFEADPSVGKPPKPRLILHVESGQIQYVDTEQLPAWASMLLASLNA